MTGEFRHVIDAKGRIIIPSQLRKELGEVYYVTLSLDKCLWVYSESSWAQFCAKIDALPLSQSRSMRVVFANTATCEPDSQGRILIPQKLRDIAGIKKNVTVIGFSNHAEIWDSEEYDSLEARELNLSNIAAAIEGLGI
ncbi:MAG: division/cell wall cluster transcriptional repressor MraZ [Oscillospiraceae bacterium]|nr:division/cell wall cluster transcriptional repressor MraZ [Oscillospiraceae bacterium]